MLPCLVHHDQKAFDCPNGNLHVLIFYLVDSVFGATGLYFVAVDCQLL